MRVRALATVVVVAVSLAANPARPPAEASGRRQPTVFGSDSRQEADAPRSPQQLSADFVLHLAQTDPVAMLEACARHYREHHRGFTATLVKRERIAGTLHPEERIRIAVRDEPYAVQMVWEDGAREVRLAGLSLGKIEGVVYAVGANGGQMTVWRPSAVFAKTISLNPVGDQARAASRYSVTEAGLLQATERTLAAWSEMRRQGKLACKYLGTRPIPELGGRVCHEIQRTCDPPEVDPFLSREPKPNPASAPADAFRTVTVMIDAETWVQVGSELRRDDGDLIGAYYFRDVELNPTFAAKQFTAAGFKK